MALSGESDTRELTKRLPRGVSIRPGRADDEFAAFDVMRRAMGYEMNWAHHAPTRHHLRNSPDCSFWLAEESARFGSPRVVGYARSIVRDGVWMLTEFFVLPGMHQQGIGGALLDRCLEDGRRARADTFLVLASHNPAADSLYLRKADCLPMLPMVLLAGPLDHLRAHDSLLRIADSAAASVPGCLRRCPDQAPLRREVLAEPILDKPETLAELDALDSQVLTFTRRPEHLLWIQETAGPFGASRLFRDVLPDGNPGRALGYAYLGAHSSGPALVLEPELQPAFVAHVSALGLETHRTTHAEYVAPPDYYWAVSGTNAVMLRWLLACGWQIAFQYLFMCSRPLGCLDRYACHNPLYVL